MKNTLVLSLMLLMACEISKAQSSDKNVWEIAGEFLKFRNELYADAELLPQKEKGRTLVSFYLNTDNQPVWNPDCKIGDSDTMKLYQFSSLKLYSTKYLLFTLKGTWQIINMKQSLPDIMITGVKICKSFNLDTDQTILFFQNILNVYQSNVQNEKREGSPIIE